MSEDKPGALLNGDHGASERDSAIGNATEHQKKRVKLSRQDQSSKRNRVLEWITSVEPNVIDTSQDSNESSKVNEAQRIGSTQDSGLNDDTCSIVYIESIEWRGSNKPNEDIYAEPDDEIEGLNDLKPFNGEDLSSLICSQYDLNTVATFDTPTDFAPYVEQAEIDCYGCSTIARPIFSERKGPNTVPQLHKNRVNRIIVYAGCFNPPHLGHLEYLCHTFLRADDWTIAAMIVPVGEDLYGKGDEAIDGKPFMLTRAQRSDLLEHPLLRQFAWIHRPGRGRNMRHFQDKLKQIALVNGYKIKFEALHGPDHFETMLNDPDLDLRYVGAGNDGGHFCSDISRRTDLMNDICGADELPNLPGCGPWKEAVSSKDLQCWPCQKFQKLAQIDVVCRDDAQSLRNLAYGIWSRCHNDKSSVWYCQPVRGGLVVFFPCGRAYHDKDHEVALSSSRIRKIMSESSMDEVAEKIGSMAMNVNKLLAMLGLDPKSGGPAEHACNAGDEFLQEEEQPLQKVQDIEKDVEENMEGEPEDDNPTAHCTWKAPGFGRNVEL